MFQCGWFRMLSIWGLGKHVHSITYHNCHILHVHEPNYLEFNTCLHNNNNVGCIHLCFVKNHTWKSHHNWNMTKIKPKKNGNNVVFVHSNIIFESQRKVIISHHIFLLPPFTYMSNKLHPIKTLANPIHFQSFRNLFTSIHAS